MISTLAGRVGGAILGALFGTAAVVRQGRPLHPHGVVFDAVVRRTGTRRRWDAEWLDRPGEDHGLVRLSRAVGLPSGMPDILGLALTYRGADGRRHDLLLATTGLAPGARFALIPRRDPATSAYTCLLPYATPRGALLLAAVPTQTAAGSEHPPAGLLAFGLLAAGPFSAWQPFGSLELTARAGDEPDVPLRFDPIVYPVPGLRWYPPLAQLREPAYAAARRTAVRARDGSRDDHGVALGSRSERGHT